MKTFIQQLFLLCLFALAGWAQTGPGTSNYIAGVRYVLVAPSGACVSTAIAEIVVGVGTIYTCQNGIWGQAGSPAGNPGSVGITQWTGLVWGTSFYSSNGAAPRLTPTYLPTDNSIASISAGSSALENDGWTGMFPDGTFVIVDQSVPSYGSSVSSGQMRISTDQGNSWSSPHVILQGVSGGLTYACCGGGITPTGRLIVEYTQYSNGTEQGVYSMYSDNEGATWSTPVLVTADTTQTVYSGMITIGGNELMINTYGGAGPPYNTLVYISSNNGASWSSPITAATSNTNNLSEGAFVYLGGETILGMIRCDGCTISGSKSLAQVLSTNNGTSWTAQGGLDIDSEGNSPWLSTFMSPAGHRVVELDYDERSTGYEYLEYGYASALIANGASGWMTDSIAAIGSFPYCVNTQGANGYQSTVHPYDSPFGIGRYYQYNTSGCPTTGGTSTVFFTTPLSNEIPYDQYFADKIGIGTTSPSYDLDDQGGDGINTTGFYSLGGTPWMQPAPNGGVLLGTQTTCSGITGGYNVLIGYQDCYSLTSGGKNVSVGYQANSGLSQGSNNTAVGYDAGGVTTGIADTALGYEAAMAGGGDNYETVIGYGATGNGTQTTTLGASGIELETFIAGVVSSGSACRITSPVSMTVSGTVYTVCSWTLTGMPAQVLSWQCQGTYTTSTSSDTLSIGMDASSAPTSETGNASINSTLTGTSTQGNATSTSSGNQNILTGASVSSVTAVPWSSFGVVELVHNTSSFAITATLTGTSPSGTIDAGSSCMLF